MTIAPNTDPDRFLEAHLARASPDLLRNMLSTLIHTLLSADADAVRAPRCDGRFRARTSSLSVPLSGT